MPRTTIQSSVSTKGLARTCAVLRQSLEQGGTNPLPFIHDNDDRQLIESVLTQVYKLFGNGDEVQDE